MALACSWMRKMILDNIGRIRRCSHMRTLGLEISGKVIDLL